MFAGVGGFSLGIGDRGECIGFSEIDKYANQVLKYHFPQIKNYGDCTKIITTELPDFDLLVGGFPCQSFSIAGKRGGFKDTRGTMFFEIARIAKIKRPAYLLLENVKGLLNHDKGNTFATIISTLDELGYDCEWCVLNSKNFGVPQNRERVFIVGYFRGKCSGKVFPIGEGGEESVEIQQEAGEKQERFQSKFPKGERSKISTESRRGGQRRLNRNLREITKNNSHGEPSFTLNTQDKHGIFNGSRIRRLTPIECERLQVFPDNWTKWGINEKGEKVEMSDTQRYKMMGNALTTNVVTEIIKLILNP